MKMKLVTDNGGRRSGVERRQGAALGAVPERRSGNDRRSGIDRRSIRYQNMREEERRKIIDLI